MKPRNIALCFVLILSVFSIAAGSSFDYELKDIREGIWEFDYCSLDQTDRKYLFLSNPPCELAQNYYSCVSTDNCPQTISPASMVENEIVWRDIAHTAINSPVLDIQQMVVAQLQSQFEMNLKSSKSYIEDVAYTGSHFIIAGNTRIPYEADPNYPFGIKPIAFSYLASVPKDFDPSGIDIIVKPMLVNPSNLLAEINTISIVDRETSDLICVSSYWYGDRQVECHNYDSNTGKFSGIAGLIDTGVVSATSYFKQSGVDYLLLGGGWDPNLNILKIESENSLTSVGSNIPLEGMSGKRGLISGIYSDGTYAVVGGFTGDVVNNVIDENSYRFFVHILDISDLNNLQTVFADNNLSEVGYSTHAFDVKKVSGESGMSFLVALGGGGLSSAITYAVINQGSAGFELISQHFVNFGGPFESIQDIAIDPANQKIYATGQTSPTLMQFSIKDGLLERNENFIDPELASRMFLGSGLILDDAGDVYQFGNAIYPQDDRGSYSAIIQAFQPNTAQVIETETGSGGDAEPTPVAASGGCSLMVK